VYGLGKVASCNCGRKTDARFEVLVGTGPVEMLGNEVQCCPLALVTNKLLSDHTIGFILPPADSTFLVERSNSHDSCTHCTSDSYNSTCCTGLKE
jgi:hypothetical protein